MSQNKIPLLLIAAGAAIALTSKKDTTINTNGGGTGNGTGAGSGTGQNTGSGSGTIDPNVTTTEQQQNLEPSVRGVSSIGSIIIDYNTWMRKDWAQYYRDLLATTTMQDASAQVWQAWNNPNNKLRNLFNNKQGFLFALSTYARKPGALGSSIQWNSTPLYTNVIDYWMGYPYWSCQDWVDWHRALEQHYGSTQQANNTWLTAWNNPQNETTQNSWLVYGLSFTLPGQYILAPPAFCPDNCDFIEYFHSKGMDVGTLFNNMSCSLQNVANAVVDVVNTGANTVSFLAQMLPIGLAIWAVSVVKKNN